MEEIDKFDMGVNVTLLRMIKYLSFALGGKLKLTDVFQFTLVLKS